MAQPLKHVGRMTNTGAKVLVVFRTLPGEANMALVLPVAQLADAYHDSIMTMLETDQCQEAFELGEMMFIRTFPDGRPMLQAMQADGRLQKVPTDLVTMTPTTNDSIVLAELNVLIAEQKNCSVDDLYTFVKGAPKKEKAAVEEAAPAVDSDVPAPVRSQATQADPLSDLDLAKSFRSQADALYKEAASLRKQADELDPPKKKAAKVAEDASA